MSKRDPIKSDPMLAQIANQFSGHDVEKSGGGYLIIAAIVLSRAWLSLDTRA